MVERQLRRRGIGDERVLAAMGEVPREEFVPERLREPRLRGLGAADRRGADDLPALDSRRDLPGAGTGGSERVLEVGTGSGYSAAVLSRLAAEVVSVERHDRSPRGARGRSPRWAWTKSRCVVGDGSRGVPERAPFDAIAVQRPPRRRPRPDRTVADGGRMVVPIAGEATDAAPSFVGRRGAGARADRPLPLRPADRRGGLQPAPALKGREAGVATGAGAACCGRRGRSRIVAVAPDQRVGARGALQRARPRSRCGRGCRGCRRD